MIEQKVDRKVCVCENLLKPMRQILHTSIHEGGSIWYNNMEAAHKPEFLGVDLILQL